MGIFNKNFKNRCPCQLYGFSVQLNALVAEEILKCHRIMLLDKNASSILVRT